MDVVHSADLGGFAMNYTIIRTCCYFIFWLFSCRLPHQLFILTSKTNKDWWAVRSVSCLLRSSYILAHAYIDSVKAMT